MTTAGNSLFWLECVKAFGPLLVSLATFYVAYLALGIARRQRDIAAQKLKLDLFEKRYVQYEIVKNTALTVTQQAKLSAVEFRSYVVNIQESKWLFGDDLFKLLDGEFRAMLKEFFLLGAKPGNQLSAEEINRDIELLSHIPSYFDSTLTPAFERYMRIEHK